MTAKPTDEQLFRLMQGGEAEAFEELYNRRQGGVYRFALRMTGSESIAEDVTQDVFLSLIKDAGQFNPAQGAMKSYLYGMARHRVFRRLQKDRSHISIDARQEEDEGAMDEHLTASDDPFVDLAREEIVDLVRQAVLSLPPHFREVIVLCHLQEMNYTEVAEIIACPIGTVRSRLNRARALLLEKLKALQAPIVSNVNVRAGQAI